MAGQTHILFLPGYYGSHLETASGQRLWASFKELLRSKSNLALQVPGISIPGSHDLLATDVIDEVRVLGKFIRIGAYGVALANIQRWARSLDAKLSPVAFDWRKGPLNIAQALDKKIHELQQSKKDRFILLAHSYGALGATYYLRYGTQPYSKAEETWEGLEKLSEVILVAPPFRGCILPFRNSIYGNRLAHNDVLLSPLVQSTFESTYAFVPPADHVHFLNAKLERVAIDLHDPEIWQKYRWSFFQDSTKLPETARQAGSLYIQEQLGHARAFYLALNRPVKGRPPQTPIRHILGTGQKTVNRALALLDLNQNHNVLFYRRHFGKYWPELDEKITYVDGDGTVTLESAKPLPMFEKTNITSEIHKGEHLRILEGMKL